MYHLKYIREVELGTIVSKVSFLCIDKSIYEKDWRLRHQDVSCWN
jgi:hypothetical protein